MVFEKDKRVGETIKLNIIVQIACIGIALGLAARNTFGSMPRYLLAAACAACGVYMVVSLLRFVRLLKVWEKTFLRIDGDRVIGLSIDSRRSRGELFEIDAQEVEDASLQEIKMTRRAPLPALLIRTSSGTYTVFGIENVKTARGRLIPGDDIF